MSTIAQQTLAAIVSNSHHTVPILEKYNLDFCCKGKRTLAEACLEKGLAVETIAGELEKKTDIETGKQMPFDCMTAGQLISYILINHHFYVNQSIPVILAHLEKVVAKHGDRYPFMIEVLRLFKLVSEEMLMHMHKEEIILFPRIKEMEAKQGSPQNQHPGSDYLSGPIQVMEMEHEQAGELLYRIRELTDNYTVPADACTTFRVSLAGLKEFEEDLHKHVHLENNLLFPQAEKMFERENKMLKAKS